MRGYLPATWAQHTHIPKHVPAHRTHMCTHMHTQDISGLTTANIIVTAQDLAVCQMQGQTMFLSHIQPSMCFSKYTFDPATASSLCLPADDCGTDAWPTEPKIISLWPVARWLAEMASAEKVKVTQEQERWGLTSSSAAHQTRSRGNDFQFSWSQFPHL